MPELLYQPFPMQGRSRGQVWRYSPEYRRPRHFHAEPELNFVTRGRGLLQVGATPIPVTAGDLCWLLPGQDHELIHASDDFELFVIGLTPELSERALGSASQRDWPGRSKVRPDEQQCVELQLACERASAAGDSAGLEQHVGDVWRTAVLLGRTGKPPRAVTRRVLTWLFEQPEITRAAVARLTRSDPSDVSRYFRRDTGLTLSAFRTRLRLLRFVQLVDQGCDGLQSAALQAGFGSYSQCHRAFHQVFTCAPRTFFRSAKRQTMADKFAPWAAASGSDITLSETRSLAGVD